MKGRFVNEFFGLPRNGTVTLASRTRGREKKIPTPLGTNQIRGRIVGILLDLPEVDCERERARKQATRQGDHANKRIEEVLKQFYPILFGKLKERSGETGHLFICQRKRALRKSRILPACPYSNKNKELK